MRIIHSRPRVPRSKRNQPVQPILLRRMNTRRILEMVQAKGEVSRAELVRLTGISPPTVSKLVRSLLDARLLEEGDAPEAALGRPAKVLRPANLATRIFGAVVDIRECCDCRYRAGRRAPRRSAFAFRHSRHVRRDSSTP